MSHYISTRMLGRLCYMVIHTQRTKSNCSVGARSHHTMYSFSTDNNENGMLFHKKQSNQTWTSLIHRLLRAFHMKCEIVCNRAHSIFAIHSHNVCMANRERWGRLIFVIVCNVHNYVIKVRVNCLVNSGLCFYTFFTRFFWFPKLYLQGIWMTACELRWMCWC